MNAVNALVIPARLVLPVHIKSVELDEAALQRVAAGDIGRLTGAGWYVYVDNKGKRTGPNFRAEVLIREAGVPLDEAIHGTALFLGQASTDGDGDVPGHLIGLAEQLFEAKLAA